MITKDDSKNAIWLAYCDLKADYDQLSKERDQLKDILQGVEKSDYRFSVEQLAKHDAGVIDETIKYMQKCYPSLCVEGPFTGGWLKALRKRAGELRQTAQESFDDFE